MNMFENGFEIVPQFINITTHNSIVAEIEQLGSGRIKYGVRNAEKKLSSINKLVYSKSTIDFAQRYLAGQPKFVRAIIFDKIPEKNWAVTWHQDKVIAVNQKAELPGWGSWTLKDKVNHVQPAVEVLQNMVTFRLHLDDSGERNGCLKVIPKSHRLGILNNEQIKYVVMQSCSMNCEVKSRDLLVMRPLIIHASQKCRSAHHRRVVHIEYSYFELPKNLSWV